MNVGHKVLVENVGNDSNGQALSRLVLQMFIDGELVGIKSLGIAESDKIKDVLNGHLSYKKLVKVNE